MHSGWPQQRHSGTGLAASIVLHAVALALFLTYRQQAPERPREVQPPLDVVFVPFQLDLPEPEKGPGQSAGDRDAATVPLRAEPPRDVAPPLIRPSPIAPLVTTPVPPAIAAPPAGPPSAAPARSPSAGNPGTGAGAGGAGGTGAGLITLTQESWIRQPTTNDWARYYPRYAVKADAQVILSCLINPKNRVHSCVVLSERPRGYGIGDAVVAMSRVFRVRPPTVNGQPRYDVRVGIRLVLKAPDEGPADLQGPF